MTIYDYILKQVGTLGNERMGIIVARILATRVTEIDTNSSILKEMPADSACGSDCARAIDHACDLCGDILNAFGTDHPELLTNALETAVRCCCVFIRG